MAPGSTSNGTPNPMDPTSGHGFFNMVNATNFVTRSKDYGTSQFDLGKELTPPEIPLRIKKPMDKPKVVPHIPKGVLKHLRHNPNARAT